MKQNVIARIRQAQQWCLHHGPAYEWLLTVLRDAAQELESESGSLWAQWMTGPTSHVRIFVTGELGAKELDSVLAFLKLQRSFLDDTPNADDPK